MDTTTAWMKSVMGHFEAPARMPVRFCVGDTVDVLAACRLPREEVLHTSTIERVQERDGLDTLYWIAGVAIARTARVLRLVKRAR